VQHPPRQVLDNLRQQEKLYAYEADEGKLLLFTQREFQALEKYPPYRVVSSLVQMQRELQMWRKIGIAIVVSFFALTLTLLNFHNNLLRETISNAKEVTELHNRVENAQGDVVQLKDQLRDTKQEVDQLRQTSSKEKAGK